MLTEKTCCSVARKLGGKKCPVCHQPIRLAIVLRLLRSDAKAWWYYAELRKHGRTQEAAKLERASIRSHVQDIRNGVGRKVTFYRTSVIDFPESETWKPFDLKPSLYRSSTSCHSGCHPGFFAAFIYCYAHRIGQKFTAKSHDMV